MTGRLAGRLIALGVTGSIAAYKSIELLRLLQAEGADVVTLLSPAATRFVAPLTFEALSRRPVETDVLSLLPDGRIGHIVVADTADAIVVAPATAHWLSAMANGLAGDTVTAAVLATSAPIVVAPAMDGDMWGHPATQANVGKLREFGYAIVEPDTGPLASGQSGIGRLAELPRIVDAVVAAVGDRPIRQPDAAGRPPAIEGIREADLTGRHIVVTAGGTAEPIDPVRFIGNRSTGKMGAALAAAALDRGARVTLVAASKLTRGEGLTLELEPTEDILAGASATVRAPGAREPRPLLIGFAAETGSLDGAADKLRRKGLDLLVANDVAEPGSGFGTDTNRVTLLSADGTEEALPLMAKRAVADLILDRVATTLDERAAASQTERMSRQEIRR